MPTTTLSNKLIAVLLSFALVFSFTPSIAFADQDAGQQTTNGTTVANNQNLENPSSSSQPNNQSSQESNDSSKGLVSSEDTSSSSGQGSAENSAANSNDGADQPATQMLEDDAAFEFIYIDQKEVPLNETQSIVVSFTNPENANSATLWYQKTDGDLQSVQPSQIEDGAALFNLTFTSNDQLGNYNLVKASWEGSAPGEAAISSDTDTGYSFNVIEAVAEENEEEVTVYSIDDGGNLTEEESVADAIEEGGGAESGVAPLSLSSEPSASSRSGSNGMVIALDPGHGGSDPGAVNGSLVEKTLNLKIAQYCKAALDQYSGITTFMTRTSDEYVELKERVARAVEAGADVFVSFHINSAAGATGFEVWVQNDSSWRYYLHEESSELGTAILDKLDKFGLRDRGNKESDSQNGTKYADGSPADYLTVLYESRMNNIPAVLIEHGFINGSAADQALLSSESSLKAMGEADAEAIAEYYKLSENAYGVVYDFDYYVNQYPDLKAVYGNDPIGAYNHFIKYGMNEGRRASVVFDPEYYLANNSEVQESCGSNIAATYEHFLNTGMALGLQGSADFSVQSYYNEYSDLRNAFGTNWGSYYEHYIQHGQEEGRHGIGCDSIQNMTTEYGGIDYSSVYNGEYYYKQYEDLQDTFTERSGYITVVDDAALLRHFVNNGMKEGRSSSESFDLTSYYNANHDLRAAYGTSDLSKYYRHYINYGQKEDRTCTGVSEITSWITQIQRSRLFCSV